MKKIKTGSVICAVVLILTVAVMCGVVGGFVGTAQELEASAEKNAANAILAKANVEDETIVSVPILYYDQVADECVDIYNVGLHEALESRQFEWSGCGYYNLGVESGMVVAELDAQYLPVAVGGGFLPNRGVKGDNFARWFNQVDGKSKSYAGTLNLVYSEKKATFEYENLQFYPLDEITVNEDDLTRNVHNHLFTLNLGVPFQALKTGKESFTIRADDDTWVFLGNVLVLDMGGIHDAMTGRFVIHENGEVYAAVGDEDLAYTGVKLGNNAGSIIRIFHADRDSANSEFSVSFKNMVLNITNTSLAKEDGSALVEIAYDPTNPSYIAPLGESLVVSPDNRKSLMTMMMVQIVAIGALGALVVMTISVVYRYSRRDHSQVK